MAASRRQVESAVERILASPELEHEARLARLLTYLVEQKLASPEDQLSEKRVGIEVFGRPADYNPKEDSVARAEVRRLRAKLEAYYQGSGSGDSVRLELPKASFRPEFSIVDVVQVRRKIELPWRPIGIVTVVAALVVAAIYFVKLPRGSAVAASGHRLLSNRQGNARTPAFSPDGERIVYSKEFDGRNSTLFIQDVSGGIARALTFGDVMDTDPAWSPDGLRVAFLRQKGRSRFALMVKEASNVTKPEVEVGAISSRGSIDWTSDGGALLVSANRVIQMIPLGGGTMLALTRVEDGWDGDSEPRSSPDGKWLAFVREKESGSHELMLMSVGGGEPRCLTATNSRIAGFGWTPDSAHIVASLEKAASGRALWSLPLNGSAPILISAAGHGAMMPSLPRKAAGLAFVIRLADTNVWSVVPGKGTGASITTGGEGDGSPQLSPDGRRLAWRSAVSGVNEIWVANADGSRARQLTRLNCMGTGSPAWSADGKQIAFESRPRGQSDLFVVDADGGEPKPLVATDAEELVPSFARAGGSIYYATNQDGDWAVMRRPLGGGRSQKLLGDGAFAAVESPDGKWIYYTRQGQEVGGAWRMPVSGGKSEMLVGELSSRFWGQWAVSRSGLFYSIFPGSGTQAIRRLDLNSGEIRDVVTLNYVPAPFERGMSITAEESLLVWSQLDRSGSDVYVVDGFRAP